MKQQEVQIQNWEDIQISHLLRTFIYSSHKATQTKVPIYNVRSLNFISKHGF